MEHTHTLVQEPEPTQTHSISLYTKMTYCLHASVGDIREQRQIVCE